MDERTTKKQMEGFIMTTNQIVRITKAAVVGFFGLYVLIVAFGNVTDYGSNYDFVEGVLSMSTTFEGNALMYRSIDSVWIYHVAYISIIIVEWFIAITCLFGSYKMFKNLSSNSEEFHESKKWGFIGLLFGIALWFFGFQVVGGEWFAMWQSDIWNGLDSAFRLNTYNSTIIIILLFKD